VREDAGFSIEIASVAELCRSGDFLDPLRAAQRLASRQQYHGRVIGDD
jgi:hypothetical protein